MEECKPGCTTESDNLNLPENVSMVSCWPMSHPHPKDRVWDISAETGRKRRSGDRVDRSFVYIILGLVGVALGTGYWQFVNIMDLPVAERPEAWENTAMYILMGLLLGFVASSRS